MKRIAPLLLMLGFAVNQTLAQPPVPGQTEAGRLIVQFSQALRPDAVISQWQLKQESWTKGAIKTPDARTMVANALTICQFIIPGKFKSEADRTKFLKTANNVKTYKDAFNALKTFEESLRSDAFSVSWQNRRGKWLVDLSKLK